MTEAAAVEGRVCAACGSASSSTEFCDHCGAALDPSPSQAVLASGDRYVVAGLTIEVLRRAPEGDWTARSDDGRHFLVSEWPLESPDASAVADANTESAASSAGDEQSQTSDVSTVEAEAGTPSDTLLVETIPAIGEHHEGSSMELQVPTSQEDVNEAPSADDSRAADSMPESVDHEAPIELRDDTANRNGDLEHVADLLSAVTHPSLPPAHCIGRHPEQPVDLLFLEYDPSAEWIPALELSSADVCRVGGQIAQALSSIHQAGFALLSLRPAAIRWSSQSSRASIARLDGVTPIGQAGRARSWGVWTAAEAGTGDPALPSSDVYSLGLVLGASLGAVLGAGEASIETEWSTPSGVDLDLLSIAMRCSDGSPAERPSLQAVALELGRIRSLLAIDWAAETAKGRVRDVQEDSWLAVRMGGASAAGGFDLFVVADGMGGMSAGEVASALAVRTFADKLVGELSGRETTSGSDGLADAGRAAFRAAADAVERYASAHPAAADLGTTLTALCISGSAALIVHAGDTRCDLIRHGEIRQLTADHTVTARLVEIGELSPEEAAVHPQRSTLYRSLSAGRRAEPDVSIEELEGEDWLVLTTDGVHGLIGPEHMLASVVESPTRAARALVADALLAGGHDNATALVIKARPVTG